jgi:hypothetical protein
LFVLKKIKFLRLFLLAVEPFEKHQSLRVTFERATKSSIEKLFYKFLTVFLPFQNSLAYEELLCTETYFQEVIV